MTKAESRRLRAVAVLAAPAAIGPWGPAQRVPGSVALNSGGLAAVSSVSCPATGGCVAGGFFTDTAGGDQPFLVTQSGGVWGSAIGVPGMAALNATDLAHVSAVSCGSAGNCAASGFYQDASGHQQAFVVNETWGTAQPVSISAIGATAAEMNAVSCGSSGVVSQLGG